MAKEYFRHFRLVDSMYMSTVKARGGVTLFVKECPTDFTSTVTLLVGVAVCSLNDNYCRSTGRKIACERMVSLHRGRFSYSHEFTSFTGNAKQTLLTLIAHDAANAVYGFGKVRLIQCSTSSRDTRASSSPPLRLPEQLELPTSA